MAKATSNIITWVLLREAKARMTEVYGSPQLAERLLIEWLAGGRLRWSCKRIDARVPKGHPLATRKEGAEFWGKPEFWRETNPGGNVIRLYVNWEESWARSCYRAWTIAVPAADLDAMLRAPEAPIAQPATSPRRQFDTAVRVLRTLYPPSGAAPASASTERLRVQIEVHLQGEQRRQGLQPYGIAAPSWKVVARARKELSQAATE
jgi:hypothetical protein